MAVWVSGASGFLGSRLVRRLAADGREVVALARRPIPEDLRSTSQIQWIQIDFSKEKLSLKDVGYVEAVIHLAGATSGASKDENFFLHANEGTTVGLLQTLADKTDQVIFASSQVVYGNADNLHVTEDFPLASGASAYACSKINTENWLRLFQLRHGGHYLALRFSGFVEGGGIIDYLIDRALTGAPIQLYSRGTTRRDYLPINAAIDVLLAALKFRSIAGFTPVNIGSGQAFSAHVLASTVCSELKSKSPIELLDKLSPQNDFVFCIDRARKLLGFNPGSLIDAVRYYARRRQEQEC